MMKIFFIVKAFIASILILLFFTHAAATENKVESYHIGAMHPNGVDVAGYSAERRIKKNIYSFYNFGLPSFAAIGINYYQKYQGNGTTGTIGVGIGSIMYGSLAYQWKIDTMDYMKLGVGLTTGVAYSGVNPVFSYEHRF